MSAVTVLKGYDASVNCGPVATSLYADGFRVALRYYNVNVPSKTLYREEAQQLSDAGFLIGSVWENGYPTNSAYFNYDQGVFDGKGAVACAQNAGQPSGTPIYFAADYDATPSDISGPINSYVVGLAESMGQQYDIGIYGSGLVCNSLFSRFVGVRHLWLAGATGWSGYATCTNWSIRQNGWQTVAGVSLDTDECKIPQAGLWSLPKSAPTANPVTPTTLHQLASSAQLAALEAELQQERTRIDAIVAQLAAASRALG